MYAYIHMYVCRFSGYIFHNIMEYFEKGYHNLCEASNRTSIPLALFWLATCRPSESGRIFFLSQKMHNILKPMQKQFYDFYEFSRLTKF